MARGLHDEGERPALGGDAAWNAFYLAALTFRAIEPWNWMGDAERIGVVDPESGEVGWAVVMGGGGEFRGLALYLGDAGIHQIERMMQDDEPEDSAMFGQDALVLGFVDRELITPEEHRRMKRLGFKFRGRGEWPQLDSHALNRMPLPPTDKEAARMEEALRQVLDVAARAADDPDLVIPDREGRRLVRVPTRAAGSAWTWRDERRAVAVAEPEPIPSFDRVRAERLRKELPRSRDRIECDLFPGPAVVEDGDSGPYTPAIFLAVDTGRGAILQVDLHEPTGREAWAQEQFLQGLEALGTIPEVIFVCRPSLHRVLAPVAQVLGVRVGLVEVLPLLEEARESLTDLTLGNTKGAHRPSLITP